jgi:hypothetical protein
LRGAKVGEAKTGYEVVCNLMKGLHGLDYLVVFDNFFTSIKLLVDLLEQGTFGIGTVHANRVGLPKCLSNKKLFIKEPSGTIAWQMHESRKVSCVTWVDRKPVLLLSTHAVLVPPEGVELPKVVQRVRGMEAEVDTSPMQKEYTDNMRGVDVANHTRDVYSSQTRSHKWWHRLFRFLIDTSTTNSFKIYNGLCDDYM